TPVPSRRGRWPSSAPRPSRATTLCCSLMLRRPARTAQGPPRRLEARVSALDRAPRRFDLEVVDERAAEMALEARDGREVRAAQVPGVEAAPRQLRRRLHHEPCARTAREMPCMRADGPVEAERHAWQGEQDVPGGGLAVGGASDRHGRDARLAKALGEPPEA